MPAGHGKCVTVTYKKNFFIKSNAISAYLDKKKIYIDIKVTSSTLNQSPYTAQD